MSISCVAVYLGSKNGNAPLFRQAAFELGIELAKNNIAVVYGGTNVGTMNALAEGVLFEEGKITGVIPERFVSKSITHDNLPELIITKDIKERKSIMENLSEAAIILPGSYGTMDELFEYAVNNQLNNLNRPIILFNLDGFYDPLIAQLKNMEEYGFLTTQLMEMFHNCSDISGIISTINNFNKQ